MQDTVEEGRWLEWEDMPVPELLAIVLMRGGELIKQSVTHMLGKMKA